MLTEEILPALEKLKKEKVDYVRWQDASTNLERLKRYVIAHEYTSKVEYVLLYGSVSVLEIGFCVYAPSLHVFWLYIHST